MVREAEDMRCNYTFCAPSCCQFFRNKWALLLSMCLCASVQSMLAVVTFNFVATSLEVRYGFSTSESGATHSFYQVGIVLFVLHTSHYDESIRRLRILSYGMFLMGIGCFSFTLPHFMIDPYPFVGSGTDILCVIQSNRTRDQMCREKALTQKQLNSFKWMFWFSSFLLGAGASPLYTLGITVLDDNLEQYSLPACLGAFYGASNLGVSMGFTLHAYFEKTFVDITLPPSGLHPEDSPSWVGAWWIIFIIGGVMAILAGLILYGFRNEVQGRRKVLATQLLPNTRNEDLVFMDHFYIVCANPTFLFVCISGVAENFLSFGLTKFTAQYLKSIFGMSTSNADSLFGMILVPISTVALLAGGFILTCFQISLNRLLKLQMILALVTVPLFCCFLMKCGKDISSVPNTGIDRPYTNESSIFRHANCNSQCSCVDLFSHFFPVCGVDHLNYVSPCYAGCKRKTDEGFFNCSCVEHSVNNFRNQSQAANGKCRMFCPNFNLFLILIGVTVFNTYLLVIFSLIATVRCVAFEERTLGLGIQWMIIRTTGMIPGPAIMTAVFESACIKWISSCNGERHCLKYNETMVQSMSTIISIICKSVSSIALLFACIFHKERHMYLPPESNSTSGDSSGFEFTTSNSSSL